MWQKIEELSAYAGDFIDTNLAAPKDAKTETSGRVDANPSQGPPVASSVVDSVAARAAAPVSAPGGHPNNLASASTTKPRGLKRSRG